MLSIEQMQAELRKLPAPARPSMTLPLDQALNYHLAEDVFANIDTPPFANSAMDGFALRFSDITPAGLAVNQRIAAGDAPSALSAGTAARIFTGAPLPLGADTVVIQEDCDYNAEHVRILSTTIRRGDNIRQAGEDLAKGKLIARKGQRLSAPLIGVLASQGIAQVLVLSPLKIALVSTGNELTAIDQPLAAGGIYDSNQHMIKALLSCWGHTQCQQVQLKDDLAATKAELSKLAQQVDLIFTFGGVSVGEEDHIKHAVSELGRIESWKVKLKPGKPLMAGLVNTDATDEAATPILGLPGNPLSAFVTFLLFGRTLLNHLSFDTTSNLQSYQIPLGFAVGSPRKRPELMRVCIHNGRLQKSGNQSSGALASLIQCDGLALIPSDICLEEGDLIDFYPMSTLLHG